MGGDGSGGSRQGQQGKVYTNRTDLMKNRTPQQAKPAPVQSPVQKSPQQNSTNVQAVPPSPPADPNQYQTQRPMEPITTGLNGGPGAGPEILPNFANDLGNMPISQFIGALAAQGGGNDLADLAERAKALGQ